MRLTDMKPGDILLCISHNGATHELGIDATFCKVLKINRVTVKVRSEYGKELNMYPEIFDRKVNPAHCADIVWR